MSCLICAGPAERIVRADHWQERKCAHCGHYRIPDSLVMILMEEGQIFDIPKARAWLASSRGSQEIAHIEEVEGLLLA